MKEAWAALVEELKAYCATLREDLQFWKERCNSVQDFSLSLAKYGLDYVKAERIEIESRHGYRCYRPGDVSVRAKDGAMITVSLQTWLDA